MNRPVSRWHGAGVPVEEFGMVKGSNERAISSIEAVLRDLDRIDLILLLLKITLVITGDQARWIRHRTSTVPATKPPSLIPFGMPLCYRSEEHTSELQSHSFISY